MSSVYLHCSLRFLAFVFLLFGFSYLAAGLVAVSDSWAATTVRYKTTAVSPVAVGQWAL